MNYTELASSISGEIINLSSFVEGIDVSSFDAIWSGDAHDALTQNLKAAITKVKEQNSSAEKIVEVLNNLQIYKNNKESIASLIGIYNSLDPTEDSTQRGDLYQQINNLNSQNISLKSSMNSILENINSVSTQFEIINYDASSNSTYKDFTNGINELV